MQETTSNQPLDVLMLSHSAGLTNCCLHVKLKSGRDGYIYLREGRVMEATLGGITGIEALSRILSRTGDNNTITVLPLQALPSKTINMHVVQALSYSRNWQGSVQFGSYSTDSTKARERELVEVSLEELLEQICNEEKPCCICVNTGSGMIGQIFIEHQQIKEVVLGPMTGLKALALLLEHNKGSFSMNTEKPPSASIKLPFNQAVEAARALL